MKSILSRRRFLQASTTLLAGARLQGADADPAAVPGPPAEPIIDIHQHTNYTGRTNAQLIRHQEALGVTTTVLLPAGSMFGLDCRCGGNETVEELARERPDLFVHFANEVCDLPAARSVITRFLKRGAIGIGEQKFKVEADSQSIEAIAEVAQEHGVPVLLHFQHGAYNVGLERFGRVLAKFPTVQFIGHAQTWWGHVDRNHKPEEMYPKGKITPGGVTDRLLTDFPNLHGDLSAGSGLNFLTRDPEQARAFLERHQDKLMFGSDCNDPFGRGPGCQGAQTLIELRRLSTSDAMRRKLLHGNARKLLKL